MRVSATFRRLLGETVRFPAWIAGAVVAFAVLGAGRLALTWLVKLWVEGPVAHPDRASSLRLLEQAGAITAVMFAALFASRVLIASVSQRVVERLRARAAARLFDVELSAARRFPAGEWLSRVFSDAGALAGFAESAVKRMLGDALVVVGAIVMMIRLDARLAVSIAVLVPLVGLLLSAIGKSIRKRAGVAQKALGRSTALFSEQLQGLSTVKNFGAEDREAARFAAAVAQHRRASVAAEAWSALLVASVFLATGFGLLAAIRFGTLRIVSGGITQGAFLAFCLYAVQAIEPLRRLSDTHGLMQRALASAARLFEVIDLEPEERGREERAYGAVRGDLRFESVSFGYRERESVFDGLTLEIGAREAVALVSSSGVGKTTLARLLLRFESPDRGDVRLDGRVLSAWPVAELRRAVCVVEQEPFLFSGSILDNVGYGAPRAPRAAALAAAQSVGLGPVAAGLPRGWDTPLAEAGRTLSGGERQRVALARAILRDPAVLVLDEALSALDGESECRILDALDAWLARRTVVAIAHRLSTVRRFPRAIVLEEGRVAADGDPESMAAHPGPFRRIFADQADAEIVARASA